MIDIGVLHPAESALPKVPQPDREALEAAVRDVTQVIEALQQVRPANEIQEEKRFPLAGLLSRKRASWERISFTSGQICRPSSMSGGRF